MSGETAAAAVAPEPSQEAIMARRVLKKIDRVIIPLLMFSYCLNFADKVILSSAAVFGLREDNVRILHGQGGLSQFLWPSSDLVLQRLAC
jgi:hypothetical protein